jgi:Polyketide cyclase / dehydrase and lipid transport
MARARVVGTVGASAPRVWDAIGDFAGVAKWLPAAAKSVGEGEGVGMRRRIKLVNGGTLVERLEEMNEAERYYAYSIIEGPLPVRDYRAAIHVRPSLDEASSTIEWTASFVPKDDVPATDAERQVAMVFEAGIANLRQKLERR